ncbi:MAG TPA: hypothetical protein GX500_00350 [Firmicutes bacterium]|nr:hypothetical protein [Candidatus Fermentithermobacillaceae bacterium]
MVHSSEIRLKGASGRSVYRTKDRKARRQHARSMPLEVVGIVYFLMAVLAGCLLVLQPARVAQYNEMIAIKERELQALKLTNEDLKKAVSYAESLEFVEKEARTTLGMVDPEEVKALQVPVTRAGMVFAGLEPAQEPGGILSLIGRIAQIFGVKEATAKGSE